MKQLQANPFLFACGVPRSGTTLLQRMLNSHPEIAMVNDSHFIPRALELTDQTLIGKAMEQSPIPLSGELINNVRQYHRFYRMEFSEMEFNSACRGAATYQQLVRQLYDLYAGKAGKRLAGEKTPDYVRRLLLLYRLFPEAKFVHLVRDGRNVALSLMQWAKPDKGPGRIALWNSNPVAVCALWWRWLALEGREQAAEIESTAYREINYEDLAEFPAETMQQLCRFLEIDYSPQMIEYHRGKASQNGSLSAKNAWLGPTTGLRNWQNDMQEEHVEMFEALASDALGMFGYEVRNREISGKIRTIADECNQWWQDNFVAKRMRSQIQQTESSSTTDEQSATAPIGAAN